MKYILEACNFLELGQRANQEDAIYPPLGEIPTSETTFVVCDGMGGHDAGEVASQTVCQVLAEAVKRNSSEVEGVFSKEAFQKALAETYDALDGKDTGAEKKMGTTMTFLKLHAGGYMIAHIGDSRVYHIRPGKDADETEILFQTRDHSLVNDLIKIGELTPEEAKHSRQKNVITRAIQPNMERRSRADIYESVDVREGDYFLLCTDGVLEQMEDENIKFIFSGRNGGIDRKKEMLVDVTADNRDNHSAVLVYVKSVVSEAETSSKSRLEVDDSVADDCLNLKMEEVKKRTDAENSKTPPVKTIVSSENRSGCTKEVNAVSPVVRNSHSLLYIIVISLIVGALAYMYFRLKR